MGQTPAGGADERFTRRRLHYGFLIWYGFFWTWMAVAPFDRKDWLLENVLALAFVVVLILTYPRFQFSTVSYCLITLFMTLHAIGAHYTYAEVPFGFWLKEGWGLSRNPFDRIVHFAYGLFLAYPIREWLVRIAGVRGAWAYYLPVSITLSQSGFFEVIEAIVAAVVSPELGSAYLGTQGDPWDAQKDMASAVVGALLAMLFTVLGASVFSKRNIPAPRGLSVFQ